MRDRKQSTSTYHIPIYMVLSIDHITPATGKTVSVTLSKNCGAFGAAAGAVTEISNGWYKLAGNTTDTDTLGPLGIRATATGCDEFVDEYAVVAYDPFDVVRLGLTALPNAAAEAAGGLYTRGTGAGQINQDANGRVDTNVKTWISGAIPAVNVTGVPKVDVLDWLGTTVATPATAGVPDVNTKALGNTAQTGRDIGASVLVGDKTGFSLSAAGIQALWDALTSALTTVGSIGKLIVTNLDAAISSRLASASYTAPPTAAAVRSEMDSNSTKLAGIQADTDDIQTRLTTAQTDITAIKAKTDGLVSGGAVTLVSPVSSSETVTIIIGDDYKNTDNRALVFTLDSAPSITGASVLLAVKRPYDVFTKAGVVTSATGCYVELIAAETRTFMAGNYLFDLQITLLNGDIITPIQGRFIALPDVQ